MSLLARMWFSKPFYHASSTLSIVFLNFSAIRQQFFTYYSTKNLCQQCALLTIFKRIFLQPRFDTPRASSSYTAIEHACLPRYARSISYQRRNSHVRTKKQRGTRQRSRPLCCTAAIPNHPRLRMRAPRSRHEHRAAKALGSRMP